MFCREAVLVNHEQHRAEAHVLYCRSWRCPICKPRRRAEVLRLIDQGEPERLITLTANPAKFDSPDERARQLVMTWREIIRRWRKRHPSVKISFLAVFEAHKSGEPHLHIVQRGGYMPRQFMKAVLEERMGAWNVDVRFIYNQKKAARYVAKYLGKDVHQFEGCKRYWRSLDWSLQPEDETPDARRRRGEWHRCSLRLEDWVSLWRWAGWRVEADGESATAVRAPP